MMPGLAVIARQRSGTNFLRSLIAASTNLANLGEVFDVKAARYAINFFNYRQERQYQEVAPLEREACVAELVGYFSFLRQAHPHHVIDIKYDQTLLAKPTYQSPAQPYPVFEALRQSGYGAVHLMRQNVCASIISHRVAGVSGIWHVPRDGGEPVFGVKVQVEPRQFLAEIGRRERELALFDSFCAGLPRLMRVRYEALDAADDAERAAMLQEMCRIGGGEFAYVGAPAFRKSLGHWLDYVENRDEVVAALAASPAYAHHLADMPPDVPSHRIAP
jgi:LPS sulfotransferase NodH